MRIHFHSAERAEMKIFFFFKFIFYSETIDSFIR